jgi:hypothetical protein
LVNSHSPYQVRCSVFDRILHSRMPMIPTPARLKRACVWLMAFFLGCRSLTGCHVNVMQTLKAALRYGLDVTYTKGCDICDVRPPGFPNSPCGFPHPRPPPTPNTSGIAAAVAAAKEADVAVLLLGGDQTTEAESFDRDTLGLVGAQQDLLEAVAAVHPFVVLVLINGGPIAIEWVCVRGLLTSAGFGARARSLSPPPSPPPPPLSLTLSRSHSRNTDDVTPTLMMSHEHRPRKALTCGRSYKASNQASWVVMRSLTYLLGRPHRVESCPTQCKVRCFIQRICTLGCHWHCTPVRWKRAYV